MIPLKLKTSDSEKIEEYDILNLTGKSLTKIPSIDKFPKLKHLSLLNNYITKIPLKIFTFTNLITLNLSKNRLKHIPPEIGKLINLNWLYLANNLLKHLPPEIGALTKLQELSIAGNQIKYLPREINLMKLSHLYLCYNQLKFLPISNKKFLLSDNNQIIFINVTRSNPCLLRMPIDIDYCIYNDEV